MKPEYRVEKYAETVKEANKYLSAITLLEDNKNTLFFIVEAKENITTRELIQSITNKDSLTAVRVAMNINDLQDKTIEKTINVIQDMDKNMKLLAVKVLELEKKLEVYERSQN